ncbi:class I SAM-dependent methyltransferase [Longispora urticae]
MNLLTDNPALYEVAFPDPEHTAARFVDGVVRRFGSPGRRLLDLGCGTGRDAGHLATLGYTAVGLETSPQMLDHARATYPDVEFVPGRIESFDLGATFDVITCMDSSLLYCHTNDDLARAFAACHAHLSPGGLFVAEMRNGAFFLGNDETLTRVHERTVNDLHATTRLSIDHGAQLLRRERIWRAEGEPDVVQHSAWRLLFPQELRYLLTVAGFEVLACFDGPGPRAEEPWTDGAPLSTALSGDRLHVVARAHRKAS